MKFLRNIQISKRYIIPYILILFSLLFIMIFMLVTFNNNAKNEVIKTSLQTLTQANVNITHIMQSVENYSNIVASNTKISEYLQPSGNGINYAKQISEEKNLSQIILNASVVVQSVKPKLFVDDTKIYANENVTFYNINTASSYPWYEDVIKNEGKLHWETINNSDNKSIISATRLIKDMKNFKNSLGILSLEISSDAFLDIIDESNKVNDRQIMIVDEKGNNVINGEAVFNNIQFPKSANGVFEHFNGDANLKVIYSEIAKTDWKLVMYYHQKDLLFNKSLLYNIWIFTLLIFALFIITICCAFGNVLTVYNKQMLSMIKKLNIELPENFETNNSITTLQQLNIRVEAIMNQLKVSISELYKAKINERDARFKALQAQINPHFLYNTLDSINWMALEHGASDISFMIDSLAKYFRLILSKDQSIVPLLQEILLAEVYLNIQKQRFNGKFNIIYDIKEELLCYKIPKLTLQPIIENALIHSINGTGDRVINIIISIKSDDDDDIIITISDDGCGIEEDKAKALLTKEQKHSDNYTASGYGIYNVVQRLEIFCYEYIENSKYGVKIDSKPGAGTKVTIVIKKHK
ncbi:MAG: histidine kinase [Clostridia bacterium]|nr:histidine kinase [Clostridia bacterium]